MAKGNVAKATIENKLKEVFAKEFVAVQDKKLYFNLPDENNEIVQVAVSMTCPKVAITRGNKTATTGLDFENMEAMSITAEATQPVEITAEETENIKKLLGKLGL